MFGHTLNDFALLERLHTRQEPFNPDDPNHQHLLDIGMVVKIRGSYHAMPLSSLYEAYSYTADLERLMDYATLEVAGQAAPQGVRVEFGSVMESVTIDGIDLETGDKVMVLPPDAPIRVSVETVATERGIVDEMEATHAPIPEEAPAVAGCKFDTDGDGNCPIHPEGCPAPAGEAPWDGAYTEEMTEQFTQEQVDAGLRVEETPEPSVEVAPEGHAEELVAAPVEAPADTDPDGIPIFDDTRQWERTIGDLPQAYEAMRPGVRLLVKAGLEDHLYTKIYTAAFQAKEIGRHREFIKAFTPELAAKLNSDGETLNAWFESWLHGFTKRVMSFDASEEVEAAIRFIMKHVPDDRKVEVRDYLQTHYVNTGIARMFPEAVRRFKEANSRATIAKPVSWIAKVADDMHQEAEKDQKRPPACDPALIDVAMALMPPVMSDRDRKDIRERLEYRLTNFGGISMDEVLTAWETGFGNDKMPALRYSLLTKYLSKYGKLYLTTKDAIVQAAKEIVYYLLAFVEQPQEEPIGAKTWQESNEAQLAWVKAVSEVIDDVEFEGEAVFLKAWNKFINENWQDHKVKLTAKEAW